MDERGRWYRSSWDKRDTVDDRLRLPLDFVRRTWGLDCAVYASMLWHRGKDKVGEIGLSILPGRGVQLNYTTNGEPVETLIRLAYSAQHIGGRRAWWVCPSCGRRCGILYCARLFVCRRCANADYYRTQQNADPLTVIDNKLGRVRRRLGVTDGNTRDGPPSKPARMHWKTYSRLAGQYMELQRRWEDVFWEQAVRLLGIE